MANEVSHEPADTARRQLTVANINHNIDSAYIQVTFYESARFYRLLKTNSSLQSIVGLLEQSQKKQLLLDVWFSRKEDDVIIKVKKPASGH